MISRKSWDAMFSVAVLSLCCAVSAQAQRGASDSTFAPLTLGPAPSQTRSANGAPGPKYWQNRADYAIRVTLDTATHMVRGGLTLRYTNNSPKTLDTLWIQTEQDPGEPISQFVQSVHGTFVPVKLENHVTETKVTLAEPIKPGATATFQVQWSFVIGENAGRMARAGKAYLIAQWYPRVNVYDEVKGWNTEPYTTGAEFFLEYGNYTMEVTVPAGYVVAATGTLDNPTEVLTPTTISRLAVAAHADTVVHIITVAELRNKTARPTLEGMLTWKFHANNVRDAVWCASPDYQWDATSWHGILAHSYYYEGGDTPWKEAADMARMSIQEYSERWLPYPYPQVSVVEGPIAGMEYPMLSMNPEANDAPSLYDVITHEVGHNWFPMIVGSNERVHTWMDEGFNQFINTFSNARRYPQSGDQRARAQRYVQWVAQQGALGADEQLETGAVIGNAGGQYLKTAGVLQMLRNVVMEPDVFDQGLRTYAKRWAYKHPTPMDFFRTMNDAAGRDLSWFWREWFLTRTTFDQAIDSVHVVPEETGAKVTVVYNNKQAGVMPLLVRFTFSDKTTEDVTHPVDIWTQGARYTRSYTFPDKQVTSVQIDPDHRLADIDPGNNNWVAQK